MHDIDRRKIVEPETKYNYSEIASLIKSAMRKAFGENATIVTNEGYSGRIYLKVVSERLNGMRENEKHQYLEDAMQDELDPKVREAISLAMY